jgi:mannose-6-phosphate isomerase-like protein (cupin superfamily)
MSSTLVLQPLSSAPPPDPRLPLLSALVSDLAARPQRWRPQVRFRPGQRWWVRLDGPPGVDVWLLSWLSSQGTELHDHGGVAAAFTVVQGALTEVRATPDGLASQRLGAGAVQTVAADVVHDVENRDPGPAVSIHAYGPRLTRMTYYEWTCGALSPTRTVATDQPESDT